MARSLVASDNFNRAGPGLGANWTQVNNSAAGDLVISASTVITGSVSGNKSTAVWAGAGTFSNDQYAKLTLVGIDFGHEDYTAGVIVRSSNQTDAARDHYYFEALSTGVGELGKVVNGTETIIHSAAVAWANGDTISLEVEGTTLRAYRNDVALGGSFTNTDSSLSTGKPGAFASGDSAVVTADNWEGGDVVAAGGGRNRSISLLGVG